MKRSRGNLTGAEKQKSSNQQKISSFFNKGPNTSQLFSSFGSSNKADKRTLNLSRKKTSPKSKEDETTVVEGSIVKEGRNRKEDKLTLEFDKSQCQLGVIDEVAAMPNENGVPSNQQFRNEKLNDSKNTTDDTSDDDLIPPTPSPVGLSRSFMKSASSSSPEEHNTCKRQEFTNLKLKQAIQKLEDQEKKKSVLKKHSLDLRNSASLSFTHNSAFSEKDVRSNGNSFVRDKGESYKQQFDNCKQEQAEDFKREITNGFKTKHTSSASDYKRMDIERDKITSLTGEYNLKNDNNLNIQSENCNPLKIVEENAKSSLKKLSSKVATYPSNSEDSSRPLLAPSKIVFRKGKSFKRLASKGNSPTKKRHQMDQEALVLKGPIQLPYEVKKGITHLFNVDDNDDIDMAHMYGADLVTADRNENFGGVSSILDLENSNVMRLKNTADNVEKYHVEGVNYSYIGGNTSNQSGATPNTHWKTPMKDLDTTPNTLGKTTIKDHKTTPNIPGKTPIEDHKTTPNIPGKTPIEDHKTTPNIPGKTPNEDHKTTPNIPGKTPIEDHKTTPNIPGKTPNEDHKTTPNIPGKTPIEDHKTTPNSPGKTPVKEYDRHLITDISLVTPTKNFLNTSRDSLLGVELDGLMDGLEWSPMPKNSVRTKLFEEYTPYTSPYRRFLVLEVYRREASKAEALSKYGRILSEKVLRLFDEGRSVERYCYLRQDWEMTEIEPGDLVHVTGDFDVTSGVCILDNQTDQYIVVHPDTLVSGTTVAGATRCLRRTILNERFRTEDTNESMLIGTLLHDLFDKAMQTNEFSKEKLVSLAKDLLQQHSYLNSLYSLGMSEVTALDKISDCIPAFSDWSKRYVLPFPDPDMSLTDYKSTSDNTNSSEQPSVCISALKDIEENVWSPRFGLKGKVDATVEVKIDRRARIRRHRPDKNNDVQTSVIPLELKTGKLLSKLGSVDHRAQAILYTLLLSDRHRHSVDSGLLYYMKSGHMVGVPALVHEKRALVMRRNEVARYLSLSRTTGGLKMPGMLKDLHTCSRCSQAQNCTLFHKSVENGNPVTSGLGELFDKLTQHLTPDHARFFADWFKLVCLEGKEVLQSGKSSQHNIWSMKGLEREVLGQCFSGMVQTSRDCQLDKVGMYVHRFERSPDHLTQTPFVDVPISTGDRVVVSEEHSNAIAIATGYIRDVKTHEVVVSLDRDLSQCYRSADIIDQTPIYRLDKDEGYNSLVTPWSNVAKLLNKDSERNADLRRLIIDLKPPVFARSRQALINFGSQSSVGSLNIDSQSSSNASQTSSGPKYHDSVLDSLIQDLNKDQKRAIAKVLRAQDYTLILGMPGTGKTTTIARLVQILVARGNSVLLTSYTHTAVDNILLKLKQAGLDFLRLGQVHKLLPEIQPYSAEIGAADIKTVNELRDFYASKAVVATTCLGVNHALFSQRSFDYCIVDEASQITQPVCLGPLRHANVFVLVGDHYQLPPLVQSLEAREGGMDVSLFKRLSEHHPQAVVCLEHQYRMHKDIMALSNTLIYEERLKCGTPQVANALLNIPQWDEVVTWFSTRTIGSSDNWLLHAVNPSLPVMFLDTDPVPGYEVRQGHLVSNEIEATLIQQLTCALRLGGVDSTSIGIISPYRQQLKLIKELLRIQDSRESRNDLEINTVDKYQGRDKPCILVSLVRSNDTSSVGDLLKDWRRVNVAVTRAKSKLILIGSLNTLRASLLLNELIDLMERNHWVFQLPNNAHKMFAELTRSLEETESQNSKTNSESLS